MNTVSNYGCKTYTMKPPRAMLSDEYVIWNLTENLDYTLVLRMLMNSTGVGTVTNYESVRRMVAGMHKKEICMHSIADVRAGLK